MKKSQEFKSSILKKFSELNSKINTMNNISIGGMK